MYGTREDLCRMLNEQYPAETPLNLIIWTPADIEALADGMEYSFSEHDVRAVLERLSLIHISEPTRLHKVSRMPSSA